MCYLTKYKLSAFEVEGKYTQRYDTAVHNCKNISLSVKAGE